MFKIEIRIQYNLAKLSKTFPYFYYLSCFKPIKVLLKVVPARRRQILRYLIQMSKLFIKIPILAALMNDIAQIFKIV
jgi:hypothetical protein